MANDDRLAKGSLDRWAVAENRNKCRLGNIGPAVPLFTDFADEIMFPRCILDEQFIETISSLDEQMCNSLGLSSTFRPNYRMWAKSLPSGQIQEDDPYDLELWGYALYSSWSSHFVAILDSGTETELRNGTVSLFDLAFQQRSGWKHLFKQQRKVFLPDAPFTSTVDIILTMYLPSDWGAYLSLFDKSYIFASGLLLGEVVTFVSEAKCKEPTTAQRLLTFDLCSAQHRFLPPEILRDGLTGWLRATSNYT